MRGGFKLDVGASVLGVIFLSIVGYAFHAAANAFGAWIILEQFDYSMPFWNYIWIGIALTILLNGNASSSS